MRLSRFPDRQVSAASAKTALAVLLASTTDEKLAGFTVDSLARMYRVDRRQIECMLLAAQDKRRRGA